MEAASKARHRAAVISGAGDPASAMYYRDEGSIPPLFVMLSFRLSPIQLCQCRLTNILYATSSEQPARRQLTSRAIQKVAKPAHGVITGIKRNRRTRSDSRSVPTTLTSPQSRKYQPYPLCTWYTTCILENHHHSHHFPTYTTCLTSNLSSLSRARLPCKSGVLCAASPLSSLRSARSARTDTMYHVEHDIEHRADVSSNQDCPLTAELPAAPVASGLKSPSLCLKPARMSSSSSETPRTRAQRTLSRLQAERRTSSSAT